MSFNEIISVFWKRFASNKSRALLTKLGVIIGVAAVIEMMAVSTGTEATIAQSINGLGSTANQRGRPNQTTSSRLATGLVYSGVAAIQSQVSGIAGIFMEQQASESIKVGDNILNSISLVGTTPDYPTVRDVTLQSGRFFNATEVSQVQKVVALGNSVASQLFGTNDQIAYGFYIYL